MEMWRKSQSLETWNCEILGLPWYGNNAISTRRASAKSIDMLFVEQKRKKMKKQQMTKNQTFTETQPESPLMGVITVFL